MKGHVRKRGKSSWAVVIDIGRDAYGRRRQKWHTIRGTRRDAERALARLVNEINTGEYVEPSNMSLAEYLESWLRDYAEPRVAPKTYERYAQIVRNSIKPPLGHVKLSQLKPLQIQAFYTEALRNGRKDGRGGLSAQTVLHFHRVLHKTLSQAVKWQLLARNPADAVEPPRPQRRQMRALDEVEIAALLQQLQGSRLHMPVLIAVTTGMRRGEILALRWSELNLETGRAVVCRSLEQTKDGLRFKSPKNERSRRTVVFPGFTLEVLRAHRLELAKQRLALGPAYDDHKLVCPRPDGTPWPPDGLSSAFASLVRRADFDHVRFHDLRHTHATQLLRYGVHPKIVSERLGHSNIGITLDTYSHVMPGMQENAVALFDVVLRRSISEAQSD